MHITDVVGGVGGGEAVAAPRVVSLRLRLKLRKERRPNRQVMVVLGGELGKAKVYHLAVDTIDKTLHPALVLLFNVGINFDIDLIANFKLLAPDLAHC